MMDPLGTLLIRKENSKLKLCLENLLNERFIDKTWRKGKVKHKKCKENERRLENKLGNER